MKIPAISLFVLLQTVPIVCHESKRQNVRTRALTQNNSTIIGTKASTLIVKKSDILTSGKNSTHVIGSSIIQVALSSGVKQNSTVVVNTNRTDSDNVKQSRIVGGITITDPLEYPYIGFPVGADNCVATLFHENLMVTSAACKDAFASGLFLGGTKIDGSESIPMIVEKVIIHPEYDPVTNANDIMIMKLVKPVTDVKKVKLNLYDATTPTANQGLEILGFGAVSENGIKSYSDTLQRARVMTAPEDRCIKYRWYSHKSMVCSWFPGGGRDSCSGDAGGPVLLRGTSSQVAIISYGNGCGNQNYPSVNTRISAYADFIKATVCAESSIPLSGITCINPLFKIGYNY